MKTYLNAGIAAALMLVPIAAPAAVVMFDVEVTSVNDLNGNGATTYLGTTGTASYEDTAGIFPLGDDFQLTLDFVTGSETFNSDNDAFGGAEVVYNGLLPGDYVSFDVFDEDTVFGLYTDQIAAPNIIDFSVINLISQGAGKPALLEVEVQIGVIPVPATLGLMLLGAAALGVAGRRRA